MNWFDKGCQDQEEVCSGGGGFWLRWLQCQAVETRVRVMKQATWWMPQTKGKHSVIGNDWMSPAGPRKVRRAGCSQQVLEAAQSGPRVPQQLWACYVWTEPSKVINVQLRVSKSKEECESPASWLGQAENITAGPRSWFTAAAGRRQTLDCLLWVDFWWMPLALTTHPAAQGKKHSNRLPKNRSTRRGQAGCSGPVFDVLVFAAFWIDAGFQTNPSAH